jgi:hypothetical protein
LLHALPEGSDVTSSDVFVTVCVKGGTEVTLMLLVAMEVGVFNSRPTKSHKTIEVLPQTVLNQLKMNIRK